MLLWGKLGRVHIQCSCLELKLLLSELVKEAEYGCVSEFHLLFSKQVDFDAPLGYKEPERPVQHEESIVSGFLEFFLIKHVCDVYPCFLCLF